MKKKLLMGGDFLRKNIRYFIYLLSFIGLLLVFFYSYSSYTNQKELELYQKVLSQSSDFLSYTEDKVKNTKWAEDLDKTEEFSKKQLDLSVGQRLLYMVAITQYEMGNKEKAKENFHLLSEQKQTMVTPFALLFLANLEESDGNLDSAVKILERFSKEYKKSFLYSESILNLSRLYINLGDTPKAKEVLMEAIENIKGRDLQKVRKLLVYLEVKNSK